MQLKSYFSASVAQAFEQALADLGEDAMLVHARPSSPQARHLGAYEVVFGLNASDVDASGLAASDVLGRDDTDGLARHVSQQIRDLQRDIERLAGEVRAGHPAPVRVSSGCDSELYAGLVESELDASLAEAAASGTPLEQFFSVDISIGRDPSHRAVLALVGPPGSGKTTTLAKLAARYGLASRGPAQILSADVFRIGAADQLRSLAAILGIGCEVVATPRALEQALEEHREKQLVFIDTPGLAPAETGDAAELAASIAGDPEIETHLVLQASMKPADLDRAIERYKIFRPAKLLFTHLDETGRYGALVSAAARHSLPISFLTAGQQIPDDLEPATKARLVELILPAPLLGSVAGAGG